MWLKTCHSALPEHSTYRAGQRQSTSSTLVVKNQLAALHNHIQSLLLWHGHRSHLLGSIPHHCTVYNTLFVVLRTSLPLLRVRYPPDGRFITSRTDTHAYSCIAQNTTSCAKHRAQQCSRKNALLGGTYPPLTSCSLTVFCLRRKTAWTDHELFLFNRNNLETISFVPFQE